MKIGVFGSGMVGNAIGTKLVSLGHEVMMGSRTADNEKGAEWVAKVGVGGSQGTFAETAKHGEILFNCTAGVASLKVLEAAGADNLNGKLLLDISNPLDFSNGFPPTLSVCNDDSLGEQIQRTYPEVRVVKTLNTVANSVMVDPSLVPGDHQMFVAGNDADAKARVVEILKGWFGWKEVLDLGDITVARGLEGYLPLWVRMWSALGTDRFNIKLQIAPKEDDQ